MAPWKEPRRARVFVKRGSQEVQRVSRKRRIAFSGAVHKNKLVYQERRRFRSYNSKIKLYDIGRDRHRRLPRGINSPHFEWGPVIWGRWLTFTRRIDRGRRDPQKLFLANLRNGNKRLLAKLWSEADGLYAGQMAGRYVTWTKCRPRCHAFLYDRRNRNRIRMPRPSRLFNYAPSVTRQGTVYFARSSEACGEDARLLRRSSNGDIEKVYQFEVGTDLSASWTVPLESGGVRIYMDLYDCEEDNRDIFHLDLK